MFDERVQIHTDDARKVITRLGDAGVPETDMFERMATLEDVFLRLVSEDEGT